jgi:hypothetical protein
MATEDSSERETSYWHHNGSILKLVSAGVQRRLVYVAPREGLLRVGIEPGTVLFTGIRDGGVYRGISHRFSAKCGAISFDVTGSIENGEKRIVLQGLAPIVGNNCSIQHYVPANDVFDYSSATGRYRVIDHQWPDQLNIRAGPGTEYSVVSRIPHDGIDVKMISCRAVDGYKYKWCIVDYKGNHGWAYSRYLAEMTSE